MFLSAALPPPDLPTLLNGERVAVTEKAPDIPALRLRALRDAALGYGVQAGMARRMWEINRIVLDEATTLDGLYDFGRLMLDRSVVPPVLSESRNAVKITEGQSIRISDSNYTIETQAHFATSAPNWRDYLRPTQVYAVTMPAAALRPKNPAETAAWKSFVAEGWTVGETQADAAFSQALSRLNRDFLGMVLYRRLLAQAMVSQPYVARADLGVTGDGVAMAINDRVLRITATPRLQTKPERWRPQPVPKQVPTPAPAPAPGPATTVPQSSTGEDL